MKLQITVSLRAWQQQKIEITMQAQNVPVPFVLEALAVGNGITVADLTLMDAQGQPLAYTLADKLITLAAGDFTLCYAVHTHYQACVGADREHELIYPFINAEEVFFGSGVLAHPYPLPAWETQLQVTFALADLPSGWQVFSTMGEGHPAKLDGFFIYCTPDQQPVICELPGVTLRLLGQRHKTFLVSLPELADYCQGVMNWLETRLAPYRGVPAINILLLQAPDDYPALAHQRSFASGENVLNGIITYGSVAPDRMRTWLGYNSYAEFLYHGLTHELLHLYTSTAWQSKYKSVLYPAAHCPPSHARLIGEALNIYFQEQYVLNYLGRSFVEERLPHYQEHDDVFRLWQFDQALQQQGLSLLHLFRALIQQAPSPYASAQVIFDTLAKTFGLTAGGDAALLIREEAHH